MDDLISKESVIECIWDVFNEYVNDTTKNSTEDIKAVNRAFRALQWTIDKKLTCNNVWIPCSEMLPKKQSEHQKRRELLVTTNTGIVGVMQFDFKSNDFWEAGDENHLTHWQEDSEDFAVIAWMPLPDPYQSKE